MSKWIKEVITAINDRDFMTVLTICERINKLLERARYSIEDPNLYDEIRKETQNGNER